MKKNNLNLATFILIVMTDVGESLAQLFMKTGLNSVGIDNITLANLAEFIAGSAGSICIWIGFLFYVINFFIWITVLTRVELSVAFPVGSTSYIFIPILAMIFLHETITPLRWAGIALIVAGIHFVSVGARNEAHNA